ncbi:MAG: hypothetical protein JW744_05635 [Candidatus Diapherotrites archaeon]|uniref:Uncharacterized protein n=1 Tax=Candidatus Iainarchaeum sp. TaxID=3101447 RepID=A0A939C9C2_9ARCH|nr:hypothetical protein [Candidatus Diapherotrites archaeon]
MQTTIPLEKETVQVLEKLKSKYNVSSYDKLIREMLEKEMKVPKSLFGAHPKMKQFKRDKEDLHEL